MNQPAQLVNIGLLELNFLLDGNDPGNPFIMFEYPIPLGAKVPVPHFRLEVDEARYGLSGITDSTINGEKIEIAVGDRLFIPHEVMNHHDNKTDLPAKTLCISTPTSIKINYFKEIGAIFQPGVPTDPKKAAEMMDRHGLIPALA